MIVSIMLIVGLLLVGGLWRWDIQRLERECRQRELRFYNQVTDVLDRIHTDERLELRPREPFTPAPAPERPFISDLPYDDERWQRTVEERNSNVSPEE